jgi:hypothetical protein
MRSFVAGLVVAVSLLVGSCGSPSVSLQSQPQDQRAARDLAKTVADKADCSGFEDYGLSAKDHWDFTCQKPNRMFLIRIVANATGRDNAIKKQEASGNPYKAGRFFVVHQFSIQGQSNTLADLADFPGDSGAHANEGGRS